jgi:hypothetical protein
MTEHCFKLTEKFTTDELVASLQHLADDCLVFHRDGQTLQEYDLKCENYVYDFIIQAVELDEVKNKLLEGE